MPFQIEDPIIWDLLPLPKHTYAERYLREVGRAIWKTKAPGAGPLGETETKARAIRCRNIVKILMGDCMWTFAKTVDHLATYLKMELAGLAWTPDGRRTWGEPDSQREGVAGERIDIDAIRAGIQRYTPS